MGKEEFISDKQQLRVTESTLWRKAGDLEGIWQQVAMGNMIQQHQEMDRSKQQLACATVLQGPQLSIAHSAASAQCGPQVGSAMGSSLSHHWPELHPPETVLMNVDARDQHSPGYNSAAIKLLLCNGPCLTAPVG